MSFSNIIGQDKAVALLLKQLSGNRTPHAYLFSGPSGVGRKKAALELARTLNCTNLKENFLSCNECASCLKIEKEIHPDIHIIDFNYQAMLLDEAPEKQAQLRIDTIRELQKTINMKTNESTWKVFIIDPAEKLTADSANCLLKTLEEPPKNSLLVLISTAKELLPQTIVSRCQHIRFNRLRYENVLEIIKRREFENLNNMEDIITLSDGSAGKAINLINDTDKLSVTLALWNGLKNKTIQTEQLFELSETVSKDRQLLNEIINDLLILSRTSLLESGNTELIGFMLQCKKAIKYNVNTNLLADILFLKLQDFSKNNTLQ
ncbi:MAG: DNA polymerase III subunit delta' [Elusimicrobia bacterium RIFOXYA2_FULL_39_19]|nr:MAG: DNA polymerase III subunit delta' [Elusimicrobia bacterium RIFOXYA2_FULL_39_19]